jgi:hypothetical protein
MLQAIEVGVQGLGPKGETGQQGAYKAPVLTGFG